MIKKIFSLFAAILFAGSMWAADPVSVTIKFGTTTGSGYWAAHTNATYTDSDSRLWTRTCSVTNMSGQAGYSQFGNASNTPDVELYATAGSDITVSAFSVKMAGASGGNSPTAGTIYLYKRPSEGADVQLATASVNGTSTVECKISTAVSFASTDKLVVAYDGSNKAVRVSELKYSYTAASSTEPYISAEPNVLDLGTIYKSSDREEALKTFTLTGVNLTNQVKLLSSGAAIAFDRSEYIDPTDGAINVEVGVFPYSTDTKGEFEATISVKGTGENPDGIDKEIVTVTWKVVDAPTPTGVFEHYTGDIVAGKYVICDGTTAMKNVKTSSNRLDVATVEVTQHEEIVNPDASVIWEIAFLTGDDADYFTIYNAEVEAYAAFTSSNGKADLLSDVTDYAKWYINEDGEFTTKQKHDKVLRYNPGYGFASYSTSTGAALKLYKYRTGFPTSVDNTVDGKKAVKFIENGQLFIELNGHVYNVQGQIIK